MEGQWGGGLRKPSIFMVNWVSHCLSFLFSASTIATYIFTIPTCTSIIIIFEACVADVEF
jgi:hypothetical protein